MNNSQLDKPWFIEQLNNKSLCEKLAGLKLVVSDIDGSLTDGTMIYTDTNEDARSFSIQDGYAIFQAQRIGLAVAFLSGKAHGSGKRRAQQLGIPEDLYFGGREVKIEKINTMAKSVGTSIENVLLFGDDHLDMQAKLAQPELLYATPQDSPFYFHHQADLVVPRDGGRHAFRLLMDLILFLQKKHFAQEIIEKSLNE